MFVPLCDNLIFTSMVRIIQASTKCSRPGDSFRVESHADDLHDESEFSEKEVSDNDSEYRHGV